MCDRHDLLMLMLSNFRVVRGPALCGVSYETDGPTAHEVLPCVFIHIATKATPDTSI